MSDKGEVSHRNADFSLIETLLWTRTEGFFLFAEHLARLEKSCAALGFSCDAGRAAAALARAVAEPAGERLRVRLEWNPRGEALVGAAAIEPVPASALWTVQPAQAHLSSANPLLAHKTTRRDIFEGEFARAAKEGADEVLFLNERGEVCEAARMNVFLPRDGALLTPPVSCGLLPGTLRGRLLAEGRAREALLQLEDFAGVEFYLGNSVRGLVRARLSGRAPPQETC